MTAMFRPEVPAMVPVEIHSRADFLRLMGRYVRQSPSLPPRKTVGGKGYCPDPQGRDILAYIQDIVRAQCGDCKKLSMLEARWAIDEGAQRVELCMTVSNLTEEHVFLRVDGQVRDPALTAGMPARAPNKYICVTIWPPESNELIVYGNQTHGPVQHVAAGPGVPPMAVMNQSRVVDVFVLDRNGIPHHKKSVSVARTAGGSGIGAGDVGITNFDIPMWGGAALAPGAKLDFTVTAQGTLAHGSQVRVLDGPVNAYGQPGVMGGKAFYKVSASSPAPFGYANAWLPPATWWIGPVDSGSIGWMSTGQATPVATTPAPSGRATTRQPREGDTREGGKLVYRNGQWVSAVAQPIQRTGVAPTAQPAPGRGWTVAGSPPHAYRGSLDLGLLVNATQVVKPTQGGQMWALFNISNDGTLTKVGDYPSVAGAPPPPATVGGPQYGYATPTAPAYPGYIPQPVQVQPLYAAPPPPVQLTVDPGAQCEVQIVQQQAYRVCPGQQPFLLGQYIGGNQVVLNGMLYNINPATGGIQFEGPYQGTAATLPVSMPGYAPNYNPYDQTGVAAAAYQGAAAAISDAMQQGQGDTSGLVYDPNTGLMTDPSSGFVLDPSSGQMVYPSMLMGGGGGYADPSAGMVGGGGSPDDMLDYG